VCPLRVFWVYKKVADSGDVVIQEQGFSIVDIHEPAIAMPLSSFSLYDRYSGFVQKFKYFLAGRHQEVRRSVSPGLHHIKSVKSLTVVCRTMKDIR
jgi:hypothetical protein